MKPHERPEFLKVLIGLAAIKPGCGELTDEALDLWWASMSSWSLVDFKKAAAHLIASCEFMPSPYHFEQLRRAGEKTPSEAWAIALRACRDWSDPSKLPSGRIARAAACVGGFRAIGFTDIKELPWVQKRFIEAYEELGDVEPVRYALPSIAVESHIALTGNAPLIGPTQVANFLPLLERGEADPGAAP